MHHAHPRVPARDVIGERPRAVGRGVVHDHQTSCRRCRQRGFNERGEVLTLVVGRSYYEGSFAKLSHRAGEASELGQRKHAGSGEGPPQKGSQGSGKGEEPAALWEKMHTGSHGGGYVSRRYG